MIRRATLEDADAVREIFLAARDRMPYLPRIPDHDRPLLGDWILERHAVWVHEHDGRVTGFAGLEGRELSHLYVAPEAQNGGIGAALLQHTKQLGSGLQLWVFQRNSGARRFYERHGFHLVQLTDGAANMEHEPDALYSWRPSDRGELA